ncbi:dCTP deaminase [Persephonella hydrogeniphila]|uniref:dCTP deaminase n=1 Tax=Persephonella hydrogeniphila TaxID=198703 RepID=A0A285N0P8_9AQUI|nr:dCTP deaminase [Persephonella hydrogeniphila]SNZ03010.1 dCTP deaminase [Persephonella hydrogeniphila]
MILKYQQIKELIRIGSIKIDPFDEELQLQPSSIDLRTSDRFYRYPKEIEPELQILDPKNPYLNILEKDFISEQGIVIEPAKFLIIETLEYISVPENITVFLQPKFRLARMGLSLINAGWLEHGYEGNITLCLQNVNDFPVRIFKNMPVVHIFLSKTE